MLKPYQLADLGKLLTALPATIDGVQELPVADSPFSVTTLLCLPRDTEHGIPTAAHEERTLLVLDGHATVTVDSVRQTLGPGQLLTIEPGADVRIWNESTAPWRALSTVTPPLAEQQT